MVASDVIISGVDSSISSGTNAVESLVGMESISFIKLLLAICRVIQDTSLGVFGC